MARILSIIPKSASKKQRIGKSGEYPTKRSLTLCHNVRKRTDARGRRPTQWIGQMSHEQDRLSEIAHENRRQGTGEKGHQIVQGVESHPRLKLQKNDNGDITGLNLTILK